MNSSTRDSIDPDFIRRSDLFRGRMPRVADRACRCSSAADILGTRFFREPCAAVAMRRNGGGVHAPRWTLIPEARRPLPNVARRQPYLQMPRPVQLPDAD